MIRTKPSPFKRLANIRSLSRSTALQLQPIRSYATSSPPSAPTKTSNFGILLLLSTLAGGAGYLFAVSSGSAASSSSSSPIPSSRYSYTREASSPNQPHSYGSKDDLKRAIAEIKGYFSATSGGEPGDQFDDFVTEEQSELHSHGFDEIGHDSSAKLPNVVVFPR